MRTIRIAFMAYPSVQGLDIVGPWEAFQQAGEIHTNLDFELFIATPNGAPIQTSTGLQLSPAIPWQAIGRCDLAIIPGGAGIYDVIANEELLAVMDQSLKHASMVASVCTGAFALAQLGILDGRRAVTHWQAAEKFRARFPLVTLLDDHVFCHDVAWTSAGVTAGMDMALAIVESLCGASVAFEVSKWMVLPFRRGAGDKQISGVLAGQKFPSDTLAELLTHIENNPQSPLDIESLAKRAGMSSRNFSRVFQRRVGVSPGRYVQDRRLCHAKRLLNESDWGLKKIAEKCGLGSVDTLRRLLAREGEGPHPRWSKHNTNEYLT